MTLRSRSASPRAVERQLVAIVAADIAGYSRLMGADEEETLARFRACRRELIEPSLARHHGRTVSTAGDGLLAEFASPVEAVRWAVEVQQGMIDRNAGLAGDKRLDFRIGINLGDVIVEDRDLYGDAVNIAARLEALAEPGGICISRAVRDQIRDRLALPFADGGEQSVKNIARPVRVHALSAEAIAALPKTEPLRARPGIRPFYARRAVGGAALAALMIIAGFLWMLWPSPPSVSAIAPAAARTAPVAAPRFSIVVLPFANLSDDREQQYFADGITEDLTTDLSNLAGMLVISRNTAFTYKGKAVDARQIGRELAVRYVLEGSVRRAGNQLRVNTQLIDAETDAHLWAERFDRDTGDLFALQNEITGRIANTLNLTMIRAEAARPTEHPDALDYIFRGRAASNNASSKEKYAEALGLYQHALVLDPESVEAQSRLATVLLGRVLDEMTDTKAADIARAEALIEHVLASSPKNPLAHYAKGQLLRIRHQCEDAIATYEVVLASNRNAVAALSHIGRCKTYQGLLDEAIALQEQAIRLSPRDPDVDAFYFRIGAARLLQSRTTEAIVWLEKARNANPKPAYHHVYLAAAYALAGETDRAVRELAEARRVGPEGFASSIAHMKAISSSSESPAMSELRENTYYAGLRKAGVPEE